MDPEGTPISARQSLLVFVKAWSEEDRDHTSYLQQVPEGFDAIEALRMGDLLYYLITGANEKSSLSGKGNAGALRWEDYLHPKLPTGVDVHDLTALHAKLLNFIPQNNYNRYTMNQIFQEDATMYNQLFENHIPLSAAEHDALQTMSQIIDSGNIEKFKLTMMYGSEEDWIRFASYSDPGATILEAFDTAKMASSAYKMGDYETARTLLEELRTKYQIPMDAFQMGARDMFIVTPSAAATTIAGGKDSKGANAFIKGATIPLLVSLDLSMPPDKKKGWPKPPKKGGLSSISKLVRSVANSPAIMYEKKTVQPSRFGGGSGTTAFRATRTGTKNQPAVQTTDWATIFMSALKGQPPDSPGNTGFKALDFKDHESLTLRFVVHANLAKGISDLLPKGILTVVIRPYAGTPKGKPWNLLSLADGMAPQPQTDILLEDAGGLPELADAFATEGTKKKRKIAKVSQTDTLTPEEIDELTARLDASETSPGRGRVARRYPSAKGGRGHAVAIDLIPKTQVKMKTMQENNKRYLKPVLNEIEGGKEMYAHFTRGQKPKRLSKKDGGGYRWRRKHYPTKKDLQAALQAKGSHIDRDGFAMRMLFARRIDNDAMIPLRLIIPSILIRHDKRTGEIKAAKGSKHYAPTKKLLARLIDDFGPIMFSKDQPDVGGWDLPKDTVAAKKKEKPKVMYNRGVAKVFAAEGLTYRGNKAFVDHIQPGGTGAEMTFTYKARMPGGTTRLLTTAPKGAR
jgi:hypothetical protein